MWSASEWIRLLPKPGLSHTYRRTAAHLCVLRKDAGALPADVKFTNSFTHSSPAVAGPPTVSPGSTARTAAAVTLYRSRYACRWSWPAGGQKKPQLLGSFPAGPVEHGNAA
jgi:hypothetical protein